MKRYLKYIKVTYLFISLLLISCSPKAQYAQVSPDRPVCLPQDLCAHHDFRTEWWYHTGHLQTEDGRWYGFELVFFRHRTEGQYWRGIPVWPFANPAHFAHFAITDEEGQKFDYAEVLGLRSPLRGGSRQDTLLVWSEEWRCEQIAEITHLFAEMPKKKYGVDLVLAPKKKPVVHGPGGLSRKGQGGTSSYYISITRYDASGYLIRDGVPVKIKQGAAWMDHEIFSGRIDYLKGWDWFSIQLENGNEIMAFLLYSKEGGIDPDSSGTLVKPDGSTEHFSFSEFQMEELGYWESKETDAKYPVAWRMTIPKYDARFDLIATVKNQELITKGSGVTYWEGSILVDGRMMGQPAKGRGYVEMSGRAGDFDRL